MKEFLEELSTLLKSHNVQIVSTGGAVKFTKDVHEHSREDLETGRAQLVPRDINLMLTKKFDVASDYKWWVQSRSGDTGKWSDEAWSDTEKKALAYLEKSKRESPELQWRIDFPRKRKAKVVNLDDLPLGARFRYREGGQIWIKISIGGYGLVAEYNKNMMANPPWIGQRVCSAINHDGENPEVILEES